MPKGHTHLLQCALKLAPLSSSLTLAKLKEEMFLFILETLNQSGPKSDFFKAPPKPKKKKVRDRQETPWGNPRNDPRGILLIYEDAK